LPGIKKGNGCELEAGVLMGHSLMRIRIELWMWLGKEPGGGFQALSEMRSFREMDVEEGLTVPQLLDRLAARSPVIEEKIFDREKRRLFPNLSVVVTHDGLVVSPFDVEKSEMKDGYKITVLPLYVGG
jgi:sulfur carrier protein ThiS